MVRALVIRAPGINCDQEMCRAFTLAGARPDLVHLARLVESPHCLDEYELIGFPGGFSYGDDIASGRIFAMHVREFLYPAIRRALQRGALAIGICNGFQAMVQVGLLPGPDAGHDWPDSPPPITASLGDNAGGRFVDRWVPVAVDPQSPCVWTRGLDEYSAEELTLPVANGEGRFIAENPQRLRSLERERRIPLRYADNFNGSDGSVAGLCDSSGRVFALMPHPDRYLDWNRHPFWTRLSNSRKPTPGLRMFLNAAEAI